MKTYLTSSVRASAVAIALFLSLPASAQDSDADNAKPEVPVPAAVVAMLEARMAQDPTERIPLVIRHEARCVAIFPNVIKAGVIVAGKRGKGLVSCRDSATGNWGPPLYYNLTEASVGLQAGIQSASIMLLVVDDKGLARLLDEDLSFGGDVGIAAGPLGAGKQVNIDSSVVSYSRSEGVFAGMQLGSSAVTYDKNTTTKAYGEEIDPSEALFDEREIPAEDLARVRAALMKFAPPKKG